MPELDSLSMLLIGGGVVVAGLIGGLALALVLRSMSMQNMKSLPPTSPGRTEPSAWKPAPMPSMTSGSSYSVGGSPAKPSAPPQPGFSPGGSVASRGLSPEATEQLMALIRQGQREEAINFMIGQTGVTREQAERTVQMMGFFARLGS